MAFVLESLLPAELVRLIQLHSNAMVIQSAFVNWNLFAHTKRKEWNQIKVRVGLGNVKQLYPYSHVRREWRTEPACWIDISDATVHTIKDEAVCQHLWGSCHRLLSGSLSGRGRMCDGVLSL